jgi:hypothetical protein
MKDSTGRGWMERRREKSFEKLHKSEEEKKEELRKAFKEKSGENIARLSSFVSFKSLARTMIPQLIIGGILAYIEYILVGPIYTIISIAVYIPMIYLYSRTLRTRDGVYLLVPTSEFLGWDRLFVSEEIWSLVDKQTHLTLESGKMNGRITYLCPKVKYLDGSNIPYWVEIAWAHFNHLKFAMFEPILDEVLEMYEAALLELAELKKMAEIEGIKEGTRQMEERINGIASAYTDNIFDLLKKQGISKEKAGEYDKQISFMMEHPEYLKELLKEQASEKEENKE